MSLTNAEVRESLVALRVLLRNKTGQKRCIKDNRGTLVYFTDREIRIMEMYYGMDPTQGALNLREIGGHYNVSPERIRQIKDRVVHKLERLFN